MRQGDLPMAWYLFLVMILHPPRKPQLAHRSLLSQHYPTLYRTAHWSTIDGGNNGSFTPCCKFFDIGDDGLIIRMTKWCVDFIDITVFYTFAMQECAQNFVGSTWIDIICSQQHKTFRAATFFGHQVFSCRNRLLVWCRTSVKHVFLQLFAFVLHWVKQQTIQFFKDG